ncbi:hypothetical protein GQ457_09G031280 [Hibiscus cannabinus]
MHKDIDDFTKGTAIVVISITILLQQFKFFCVMSNHFENINCGKNTGIKQIWNFWNFGQSYGHDFGHDDADVAFRQQTKDNSDKKMDPKAKAISRFQFVRIGKSA